MLQLQHVVAYSNFVTRWWCATNSQ